MRWIAPMTADPKPAAVPDPFATDPDVIRRGGNNNGVKHGWGRSLLNIGHGARRRFSGGADGAGGVDHVVDNLVADTRIAQVNDVGRGKVKDSAGIFDLIDHDILADAGFGE